MPRAILIASLIAPSLIVAAAHAAPAQTESDAYTRYELLSPASHKFRILYDVTATTAGATRYFNPIRPGSTASDESVTDRATGQPLPFAEVDADEARAGGVTGAAAGTSYIAVTLARPVPANGGGARIRIIKTYEDAKTYRSEGDAIIFDRSLGIRRNAVVLPAGYRLAAVNVPVQVLQQADGRIAVSFLNTSPAPMPLVIRAVPAAVPAAPSSQAKLLAERASQTRNIVYYLRDPDSHTFDLTHDYTEERPGIADYVNIVRTGSTVSNPSARDLDTGAALSFETVTGPAIARFDPGARDLTADTTAVVFHFPAVTTGTSRRIRMAETYTDPARYTRTGDELVWHRAFGRPANAVVLPPGWILTNASVPATVSETDDGRTRLDFTNPRTDEIDVVITARRAK
ncbi:MAG: hypothetical protein WCO11_12385 [Sphingomonadales bacterium]|jgi:hypothetical protein